jgi:hypothetical protein
VPPKGEPLEPRFDRGEIAKNQTYMPPVLLVSLLPMECMKRDTTMDECDGWTINNGHRELRFRKNPPPAVKCEFPKAPRNIGRESCESGLRANLRIRPRTIPEKNTCPSFSINRKTAWKGKS